jgi:cell division protein FtsB
MIAFQDKKHRWQRFAYPAVVMAILLYLAFHALNGNHGLYALFMEQRRAESLNAELKDVTAQRQILEADVHGLSDQSLDPDLLDERARIVLGYSNKDEMIHLATDDN